MTDILITYKTAELAKEKGFNIAVGAYYTKYLKTQKSDNPSFKMTKGEIEINYHYIINNSTGDLSNESYTSYAAPSQSVLQRWLREVHDIHIYVDYSGDRDPDFDYNYEVLYFEGNDKHKYKNAKYLRSGGYVRHRTHEEALEEALLRALNLIK